MFNKFRNFNLKEDVPSKGTRMPRSQEKQVNF